MAKKHFLANEKCTLKIAQNSQFQQCWDFDFSMAFPNINKWSGEDRIHTLGPIWIKYEVLIPQNHKTPCHLVIPWFWSIFKPDFLGFCHLGNTKVNKCWPKFFHRNKLLKLNKKHIYSFFMTPILFSQSWIFDFLD